MTLWIRNQRRLFVNRFTTFMETKDSNTREKQIATQRISMVYQILFVKLFWRPYSIYFVDFLIKKKKPGILNFNILNCSWEFTLLLLRSQEQSNTFIEAKLARRTPAPTHWRIYRRNGNHFWLLYIPHHEKNASNDILHPRNTVGTDRRHIFITFTTPSIVTTTDNPH